MPESLPASAASNPRAAGDEERYTRANAAVALERIGAARGR